MKINWPNKFSDGDYGSWLQEFEAICELNGVNVDQNRIAALSGRLLVRAKVAALFQRQSESNCGHMKVKAALMEESS